MTSTNDGKDVKSNQTSGPKAKTYFIELYKSLEARLSEGGDASERTKHLCEAWRRVHSLCQHSAPSTHTHLLSWLQRHTARAVLQTEWQTPKRKHDRESLEEAIDTFIAECEAAKVSRDGSSAPWEAQLVARGEWFKRVLEHPWDHPVLTLLLNPNGTPPTDDEILEWLKEERGVTFVMRLYALVGEKCDDIAMSLATAVMERARAAMPPVADAEEPIDKPPPENDELTFGNRLKEEAGFTADVWETLTDIEFVLMHKRDSNRCIALAKQTPLAGAYLLIERLQKRLEISPREKRLWKNAKEVAVLIAQVVIARCMMIGSCLGAVRNALYCCVRLLARLLPATRLPPAADALANQAPTARHLHTLAAAVDKQLSPTNEEMRPYICELYVRAMTAGMNELERLKLKTEKEVEARSMEKTLASWFVQLGDVLGRSDRVLCECTLTAFSLHPSLNMYRLLDAAPQPAPQAKDCDESKEVTVKSEFGSWASDSRSQTNFVKTSETLNLKHSQNQANVLSTAIFNEGEALGLSPELCQDLAMLLSGPRVKTLSWDMDRSLLLENCRVYMERTHGGTRVLTRELKYLNIDPNQYKHLPEEHDDDENDPHYGIERGYEHLVPEEIWEDAADLEITETASSCIEDEFIAPRRKKKNRRVPLSSDEDSDPLSFMAEAKRVVKKKERPLSKERSKATKKKQEPVDPLAINSENQDQKPKEKKERKKKEKTPKVKPDKSLANLVGLTVVEKKKSVIKDITMVNSPVTDSDYDSQGKNSVASLNSEDTEHLLYDDLFRMGEFKSFPQSNSHSLKKIEIMNKEFGIPISSAGVKGPHPHFLERPSNNLTRMTYRPPTPSPAHRQSPLNHPRHLSPNLRHDVRMSLTKLLDLKRKAAMAQNNKFQNDTAQSPQRTPAVITPNIKTAMEQNYKLQNDTAQPPQRKPAVITPNIKAATEQNKLQNDTAQSPHRKLAIITPKVPMQTNVSPKAVTIPEIPKSYIDKKNAEKFAELKREVDKMIAQRKKNNFKKAQAAIPSPVIQFASTSDVNKKVTNKSRTRIQQSKVNPHKMTDPGNVPYDRLMAEIAERQDLHRGNHKIVKPPHTQHQSTQSTIPVHRSLNAETAGQRNYQNFLKEYEQRKYSTLGRALDMSPKKPSKDLRNDNMPDNRLAPVEPSMNIKVEPKTPQSAKQTYQKKPEVSLNTFSRLSYMHKNKQTEMKNKNSPHQTIFSSTTYQEVSSELDEIIKEHQRAQMKVIQAKNERLLKKTSNYNTQESIKKYDLPGDQSQGHPLLSNLLQCPSSTITKQIQRKPTTPPKTSLSEKDQNDLLHLLRQQNKLNSPLHHTTNMISKPSTSRFNNDASNNTSPMINCNSTSCQNQTSKPDNYKSTFESKMINVISNTLLEQSHDAEKRDNDKSKSPILATKNTKVTDSQEKAKKIVANKGHAKNNPIKYIPESEKLEWQAVMSDILKHKTPSRGPNALDVTLNKNSFELAFEKSLQQPSTFFAPQQTTSESNSEIVKQHGKTYPLKLEATLAHSLSILSNKGLTIQAAAPKQRIISSEQKQYANLKKNNSSISDKLMKQISPVMAKKPPQEAQRKQFIYAAPKHNDPFISGIPNSDYDLLEELMDDDLRKEIGELSSDDESYNVAAQSFLKASKGNEKRVCVEYNKPFNYMAASKPANKVQCLNARQPSIEMMQSVSQKHVNKMAHGSNTTKVPQKAANNKAQDNTCLVTSTTQNVTPHVSSTHKRENQTYNNTKILTNNPASIDPNIYISAVPQQAPLQNVVLIGSQLVYEGYSTVQTPVHGMSNIAPSSYVTVNNTPNMTLYQTSQFSAPVASPLIIASSMAVPILNTIPCAAISVPPDVAQPAYPTSTGEPLTDLDLQVGMERCNSIAEKNPVSETDCSLKDNKQLDVNKTCERKVLSEVQELAITEKIDKAWSQKIEYDVKLKKDASLDQQRLKNKRLAIINREISHRCGDKPIPLTYAPLPQKTQIVSLQHNFSKATPPNFTLTQSKEDKHKLSDKEENKLQALSDAINEVDSPATPDSNESKENKNYPTVRCRRIMLRSSNKITSNSNAETVVSETTTSNQSKVKLKSDVSRGTEKVGDNASQNNADKKESTTQKRASKRLHNKTLQVTKDVEKTPLKNQPTSRAKVLPKNKVSKLKDKTIKPTWNSVISDMKIFDIESELLASKIYTKVAENKGSLRKDSNMCNKHEVTIEIPAAEYIATEVSLPGKTENILEEITHQNDVAIDSMNGIFTDKILNVRNEKPNTVLEDRKDKFINDVTEIMTEKLALGELNENLTPSDKEKPKTDKNINHVIEDMTEKPAVGELSENFAPHNEEPKLSIDAEDINLIQVYEATSEVFTLEQRKAKVDSTAVDIKRACNDQSKSEATTNITTAINDQNTSGANIITAVNDQNKSRANISTAVVDPNTSEVTANITTVNDQKTSRVTANITTANDQNTLGANITTAVNDLNTSRINISTAVDDQNIAANNQIMYGATSNSITTIISGQNISAVTANIMTVFNDQNTYAVTANVTTVNDKNSSGATANVTTAGIDEITPEVTSNINTAVNYQNKSEVKANITTAANDQNMYDLLEKENIDLDMTVTCEEVKISKMLSAVSIISARNKTVNPENIKDVIVSEVSKDDENQDSISSNTQTSETADNIIDNGDVETVQGSRNTFNRDQETKSNQVCETLSDGLSITNTTVSTEDGILVNDDVNEVDVERVQASRESLKKDLQIRKDQSYKTRCDFSYIPESTIDDTVVIKDNYKVGIESLHAPRDTLKKHQQITSSKLFEKQSLSSIITNTTANTDDDVIMIDDDSNVIPETTDSKHGNSALKKVADMGGTGNIDMNKLSEIPQSFKDNIKIEHLPSDDPLKKSVRISLSNGKVFKATVHGEVHVTFDTLFSYPSIKSALLNKMNNKMTYVLNIKRTVAKNDPNVLLSTEIQENKRKIEQEGPIETVDLLSDDDDDGPSQVNKLEAQAFETEFGKYQISSIEKDIFTKHQNKFNQKAQIFLKKCDSKLNEDAEMTNNGRIKQSNILPLVPEKYITGVINDIENKIKSEIKNTSNVITDFIEIDDSSNDSSVYRKSVRNIEPDEKIKELKNVLLEELGVEEKAPCTEKLLQKNINDGNNSCIGKETYSIEDSRQSSEMPKLSVVSTGEVCPIDNLNKEEQLKIMNNKCYIKLVRCDALVKMFEKEDRDAIKTLSEITLHDNPITITEDFSILDDLDTNIVESEARSSSPVIELSNILVSLDKTTATYADALSLLDYSTVTLKESAVHEVNSLSCEANWFSTKPALHLQSIDKSALVHHKFSGQNIEESNRDSTPCVCKANWFTTKPTLHLQSTDNNVFAQGNIHEQNDKKINNGISTPCICKANWFTTKPTLHLQSTDKDVFVQGNIHEQNDKKINNGISTPCICKANWFTTKPTLHLQSIDNAVLVQNNIPDQNVTRNYGEIYMPCVCKATWFTNKATLHLRSINNDLLVQSNYSYQDKETNSETTPCAINEISSEVVLLKTKCAPSLMSLALKNILDSNVIYEFRRIGDDITQSTVSSLKRKCNDDQVMTLETPSASKISKLDHEIMEPKLINCSVSSSLSVVSSVTDITNVSVSILEDMNMTSDLEDEIIEPKLINFSQSSSLTFDSSVTDITNVSVSMLEDTNITIDLKIITLGDKSIDTTKSLNGTDNNSIDEADRGACDDNHNSHIHQRNIDDEHIFEAHCSENQNCGKENTIERSDASNSSDYKIEYIGTEKDTKDDDCIADHRATLQSTEIKIVSEDIDKTDTEIAHIEPNNDIILIDQTSILCPKIEISNISLVCNNECRSTLQKNILTNIDSNNDIKALTLEMESGKDEELYTKDFGCVKDICVTISQVKETANSSLEIDVPNMSSTQEIRTQSQVIENDNHNFTNNCGHIEVRVAKIVGESDDYIENQKQQNDYITVKASEAMKEDERLRIENREKEPIASIKTILDQESLENVDKEIKCLVSHDEQYLNSEKNHDRDNNILIEESPSVNSTKVTDHEYVNYDKNCDRAMLFEEIPSVSGAIITYNEHVNTEKNRDRDMLYEKRPSLNYTMITDHEYTTSLTGIPVTDRIIDSSNENLVEIYVFTNEGVFLSEGDPTKELEEEVVEMRSDDIIDDNSLYHIRNKIHNDETETCHLTSYEQESTFDVYCSDQVHDHLDVEMLEKERKKVDFIEDSDEYSDNSIKNIANEEKATTTSLYVRTHKESIIDDDCCSQLEDSDNVDILQKDVNEKLTKHFVEECEITNKNIGNDQKATSTLSDVKSEIKTTVYKGYSSKAEDNQTDHLDVDTLVKYDIDEDRSEDFVEECEVTIININQKKKATDVTVTDVKAETETNIIDDCSSKVEDLDNQSNHLDVDISEKCYKNEDPPKDLVEECEVTINNISNEQTTVTLIDIKTETETTINYDCSSQVEDLDNPNDYLNVDDILEKGDKYEDTSEDYVEECEVTVNDISNEQNAIVIFTDMKADTKTTIDDDCSSLMEYLNNQDKHDDMLEKNDKNEDPSEDFVGKCEVTINEISNEQKSTVSVIDVKADTETTIDYDSSGLVKDFDNQTDNVNIDILEKGDKNEDLSEDFVGKCEVTINEISNEQKSTVTVIDVKADTETTIDYDSSGQVKDFDNQTDNVNIDILEKGDKNEDLSEDFVEGCEVTINNEQQAVVSVTDVKAETETVIDKDWFSQVENRETDHLDVDILFKKGDEKVVPSKDCVQECEVTKSIITCSDVNAETMFNKYLKLIRNDSNVLQGIVEYEDPESGTCYVVPIIEKTSEPDLSKEINEEVISRVTQDLDVKEIEKVKDDVINVGSFHKISQPSPSMEVNKHLAPDYDEIERRLAKIVGEPLMDVDSEEQTQHKSLEKQTIPDTEVILHEECKNSYSVEVEVIYELDTNDQDHVKLKTSDTESFEESYNKECSSVNNDIANESLKVMVPKHTYARGTEQIRQRWKNLKRKMDMSDVKIQEKKYRKGKNIDYPKCSAAAMSETAYTKEYKRLFDYCSSIKFSYAIPFHKDDIDVHTSLKSWPIKSSDPVTVEDPSETSTTLFAEIEKSEFISDPLEQTLSDEIITEFNEYGYKPCNIDETNFNTGFGERSGRVIQKLKDGDYTTFSAATLSDVKQLQPLLPSDEQKPLIKRPNCNGNENQDQKLKLMRFIDRLNIREKVQSFFKKTQAELTLKWELSNKKDYCENTNVFSDWPFGLASSRCIRPPPVDFTVNVVQVGQLPVSAAAQNPVTCDPRVTHVSNASPSQCSPENSSGDDIQTTIKTEYTELTTADITIPFMQEYVHHHHSMPAESQQSTNLYGAEDNMSMATEINTVVKIELMEETSQEKLDENIAYENKSSRQLSNGNVNNGVQYQIDNTPHDMTVEPDPNAQEVTTSLEKPKTAESFSVDVQHNETLNKSDPNSHALNVASVTAAQRMNRKTSDALADSISQKAQTNIITSQGNTNNFSKSTSMNAITLQQALAQILPPPLNQSNSSENNQQTSTNAQVLHIVQSNNAQSVINKTNGTQLLHIVQNKNAANTKGISAAQPSSFSGLSLIDGSIQQNGNPILHIVNTGNQKNSNAGQLLKRVNLLTNLANVQGSNEQKMVQFVCKSADGKTIQLPQQQRGMVLRLHPLEPSNISTTPKQHEARDPSPTPSSGNSHSLNGKEHTAQEMKSRSLYEENYAKFVQNGDSKPIQEKATSLPKFNQVFGKQGYQDKKNEMEEESLTENAECPPEDNNVQLEQINDLASSPILTRKTQTQPPHVQPNLVQQIKQTIGPMNIQTMHGGVIYTRQIPVNIGGGQTINLITVPSTELVDESAQKHKMDGKFGNQEGDPPIIKIVPTNPASNSNGPTEDNNAQMGSSNEANPHPNPPPQPQPVLTQMRIKLPMLSKTPQMVGGTRVVRPSFFQIQRNVIGGANQQVYQQLVLTAAPSLGQSIRIPAQAQKPKTPSDTQSSPESQMSSSTLEQLREFDMVLEQVKERSTVQPGSATSNNFTKLNADTTDSSPPSATAQESPTPVLYSVGNTQPLNMVNYANRKPTITSTTTSSYERSPDSTAANESPSSSTHAHLPQTVTSEPCASSSSCASEAAAGAMQPKSKKKKPKPSNSNPNPFNIKNTPKPSSQKPLEDEQTTQRILYILAEYKEQVENSPDKDKPAPRRRNNPAAPNGAGSSKRKKSSSGSRRRDMSPVQGEDSCRTMGSEDSSCGTSMGECNECLETHSPEESPRKVVRRLTFEQETNITQTSTVPQRNVIVTDGQAFAVRGAAGKPAATVLMPANYLLPVSMVKGGQQIAIVTNRGPKLLVGAGEGGTGGTLLLQRLIGPAGLKPMLARPGVRHIRLPTAALHNLQAFNIATSAATAQPPDSTASPAPAPAPPDLVDTRAMSSPWPDRDPGGGKPDRGNSSPEGSEPWNLPSSSIADDYGYEEIVRTDNMDRTVLDAIPDRYSPDMEAQRIFDKMFDVDSKKSMYDSRCGYDIDASDDDKAYHQVVQRKDGRHTRMTHVSAAALRHKCAILEQELRLQKSLSEECEDLGVDSPSASDLFPEAELLFAPSPAHEQTVDPCHTPQPTIPSQGIPQPDLEDQIATDHLLTNDRQDDLDINLDDVGEIVTVGEDGMTTIPLDHDEFARSHEEFARSHPNTTFHSEPEDGELPPFAIAQGIKGRQITFHTRAVPGTVVMAPQTTVISQATIETGGSNTVKFTDIDNMINAMPSAQQTINNSVLVKDSNEMSKFDRLMNESREIHSNASAIVHSGNGTQVIRRVHYESRRDSRYLIDDPDALMTSERPNDRSMHSMDEASSPERHPELFWDQPARSERRRFDFSSDSDKCSKSSYDEPSDSVGIGAHTRLDSVIKAARTERRRSDGSSTDDYHPPLRTYPPKRAHHHLSHSDDRSLAKTRISERCQEGKDESRRRASNRGVVKRGCHCCNGSTPPKQKKSRPKKSNDYPTN